MQTITSQHKLLSLLLVFLSENYETKFAQCDDCKSTNPRFGKTFLIDNQGICVDCVIDRIEGMKDPSWRLPVGRTET